MRFAPQPRATFEHLNFQERSRGEVLLPFWFLTSKRASRHKGVHFFHVSTAKSGSDLKCFSVLTSTCSSRHSSEQFLISQLPRWLHNRRFSEPTFRPSRATKQWKTECFTTFLPIHDLHLLSFDSFSSLSFFLLLLSSLTLPTSAASSVHIIGSLTSLLINKFLPWCGYIYIFRFSTGRVKYVKWSGALWARTATASRTAISWE